MKYLVIACLFFAACNNPNTEAKIENVENELNTLGQKAGPVLDSVGEKLERAGERLKDEFDTLKRNARPALDTAEKKLERAGEKIEEKAKKLDRKVKEKVNEN